MRRDLLIREYMRNINRSDNWAVIAFLEKYEPAVLRHEGFQSQGDFENYVFFSRSFIVALENEKLFERALLQVVQLEQSVQDNLLKYKLYIEQENLYGNVMIKRGAILYMLERRRESEAVFDQLLELQPENTSAKKWRYKIQSHYNSKRYWKFFSVFIILSILFKLQYKWLSIPSLSLGLLILSGLLFLFMHIRYVVVPWYKYKKGK